MVLLVFIWLFIVIIHAVIRVYLYPLYFGLTRNERVKKGYLRFSENTTHLNSFILLKSDIDMRFDQRIYYRFDINLKGLFRALFKSLDFKTEVKKLNRQISDTNAVNPQKYFELKKKGKISW